MVWSNLRGVEPQVEMFRRAFERGREAHAYLLAGPAGVGKRLFARTVAQCLFCRQTDDVELDACGDCNACRQVLAGTHPDLLTIELPPEKRDLPIELLVGPPERRGREGLCHDIALRPMSADRRVAVIDDADTMTEAAANALLKTLEEPPSGALLFLIASAEDALLTTIRSRCQTVRFSPLSVVDVAAILKDRFDVADDAANRAAELSQGSLATAQRLVDPELRELREIVEEELNRAELRPYQAAERIVKAIEDLSANTAAQRENAGWMLQFGIANYQSQLRRLSETADVDRRQFDVVAERLERCTLAVRQLQQSMQVSLCVEGLFDSLARIGR